MEMERLKKEIEKSVRRTGMNVELELVSDKVIRVCSALLCRANTKSAAKIDPPPAVEWWDAQLAPSGYNGAYENNSISPQKNDLITNLVQHPVPVKPPHDNSDMRPRPIMLTKKVCSAAF